MRWLVVILLLLGAVFCVSALDPATGSAGLLWPFSASSRPVLGIAADHVGSWGSALRPGLAAVACLAFFGAAAGVFLRWMSINAWNALVIAAIASSATLYGLFADRWMIVPGLVDVALLWGATARRWSPSVERMRTVMALAAPTNPLMRIPVPWTYVMTYLVGVGLERLLPLARPSKATNAPLIVGSLVLIAAGVLVAFTSLGIFRSKRTTTVPFETPNLLVTWGAYRWTRNPMYVGLALIYLGVAAELRQAWPALLLPLFLGTYMNGVVIPVEESRLHETFGGKYDEYAARVRRWL